MRNLLAVLSCGLASLGLAQNVLYTGLDPATDTRPVALVTALQSKFTVTVKAGNLAGYTIPATTNIIYDTAVTRSTSDESKILTWIQNGGTYVASGLHDNALLPYNPATAVQTPAAGSLVSQGTVYPTLVAGVPSSFLLPAGVKAYLPSTTAFRLLKLGTTDYGVGVARKVGSGWYVLSPFGEEDSTPLLASGVMTRFLLNLVDWGGRSRAQSLVFHNATTGGMTLWYITNGLYSGYAVMTNNLGLNRTVAAMTDLNADGYGDLVLRQDSNAEMIQYYFNNVSIRGSVSPVRQRTSTSILLGQFDIDGDGSQDTIWWNDTANTIEYDKLQGSVYVKTVVIGTEKSGYSAVICADFDRDGDYDILWRNNSNGSLAWWKMDGPVFNSGSSANTVSITGTTVPSYTQVTAGDYNNDGKADIAFYYNPTRAVTIWLLNSGATGVSTVNGIGNGQSGWTMQRASGYWW